MILCKLQLIHTLMLQRTMGKFTVFWIWIVISELGTCLHACIMVAYNHLGYVYNCVARLNAHSKPKMCCRKSMKHTILNILNLCCIFMMAIAVFKHLKMLKHRNKLKRRKEIRKKNVNGSYSFLVISANVITRLSVFMFWKQNIIMQTYTKQNVKF